jgi:hypothetical protein
MENGFLCAFEGIDSAADEFFSAGRENLNRYIVRDYSGCLDQALSEVEVCLRCGGEGDFDFLVSELYEHLEVVPFLRAVHGIYQTLVTVSKIGRQPSRRLVDGFARPLAIWEVQRLESLVFLPRLFEHRHIEEVRRRDRLRSVEGDAAIVDGVVAIREKMEGECIQVLSDNKG